MPPSADDYQDLSERFISAFKSIEEILRERIKRDTYVSFSQLVDQYSAQYPIWNKGRELKRYAELRNFISHTPTQPFERLAVPIPQVVEAIEAIKMGLTVSVVSKFARPVNSLEPDNSLAHVLKVIKETSYSQFPVHDHDGRFQGLLTENGITRWLANHTVSDIALVDFDDVRVATVIKQEEAKKRNYLFVARTDTVDETLSQFARNSLLEAILITQNGKQHEKLLGIVTRWDVLSHNKS